MSRRLQSIFLIPCIITLGNFPVYAGQINRPSLVCQEVGVILKSPDPDLKGFLCAGDRLIVDEGNQVMISCRFKPLIEWIGTGEHEINRLCPSEQLDKPCHIKNTCYRNQTKITLIGNTFAARTTSPVIRWTAVDEAQGYELIIQSVNGETTIRQIVQTPEYSLKQSLEPGSFLSIDIYALGTTSSSRFPFYILSEANLTELNTALEIVRSKPWSAEHKAIYQDSIFTNFGLLLYAIAVLETSPALKSSTELQQRLSNRYLDAGLIEKAKKLRRQSQLPNKTKFPQK